MPEGDLFLERRVHPRVPLSLPVRYRVIDDQAEIGALRDRPKDNVSQTRDVSLGGVYIASRDPLEVGNILRLELTLPREGAPLSAFAEVVWCSSSGCGLHFLAIRDEDLESLKALLEAGG